MEQVEGPGAWALRNDIQNTSAELPLPGPAEPATLRRAANPVPTAASGVTPLWLSAGKLPLSGGLGNPCLVSVERKSVSGLLVPEPTVPGTLPTSLVQQCHQSSHAVPGGLDRNHTQNLSYEPARGIGASLSSL